MNVTKTAPSCPPLWAGVLLNLLGWLVLSPTPAQAAEKVYISYGLLERSIPVSSLEAYAKDGTIDDDLAVYAQYGDAKQLAQLQSALVARADVDLVTVAQFLYTPQGEVLLKRLGQVIQPETRDSGFKAIRAALILAAADPQGLTFLNILRRFPTRALRIDVAQSLQIAADVGQLIDQTQRATTVVTQAAQQEQATDGITIPFPDLRQRGSFTWQKQTIALVDPSRSAVLNPTLAGTVAPSAQAALSEAVPSDVVSGRSIPVDLYLPTQTQPQSSAPVVVISHGLGSDRTTFAYLAIHLASYGFAVLVPEHPGSNAARLQALVTGTASEVSEPAEFVNRPLDITFVLNQVESRINATPELRGRLNFQQVGVLGQSFGGYTALALAGAPINSQQLQASCQNLEETLNLSLLLQCRAGALAQPAPILQDGRIKAVFAINPITSAVLGQASISQIKVPTLMMTGNADTIAPAVPEQIQPFTWLTTTDRYLVLMEGGTHFSTLDPTASKDVVPLPQEVIGPSPATGRRYVNALAVAFFQTYIAKQPTYRSYLSPSYSNAISEAPLPLTLLRTLTADQLNQIAAGSTQPVTTAAP
ncbi:alpha/beta hydrolase [Leptolyngbya sp. FACHB-321]|uniref:alpha/beta hydrolase n=1 Tax=Leptolyngbya sp. FACHB-321 TaxID=2692807 RepID=UPI001684BD7D|nr:alpha/beta hydrolase [Leptolyngbya sp. FACHB-321]MBD2037957.1 alpha/beta hydrolase [Leptolyngbya sp. FACHB-321]